MIPAAFKAPSEVSSYSPSHHLKLLENNSCDWECYNKIAEELSEPFYELSQIFDENFSLDAIKKELTEVYKMQFKYYRFI